MQGLDRATASQRHLPPARRLYTRHFASSGALLYRRVFTSGKSVLKSASRFLKRCRSFAVTTQSTPGKEIFATELNVLWGDMDAYNHVNNVSYFRYLEETRVRWMMKHNFMEEGIATRPVLVKSGVTFLKSALYPATLRVNVCLGEHSARSISLRHEIRDAAQLETCYAEGYAKLVWVDIGTGKSVPLPPEVIALFE
jgi:acyl-CoA thioester hydrolase